MYGRFFVTVVIKHSRSNPGRELNKAGPVRQSRCNHRNQQMSLMKPPQGGFNRHSVPLSQENEEELIQFFPSELFPVSCCMPGERPKNFFFTRLSRFATRAPML